MEIVNSKEAHQQFDSSQSYFNPNNPEALQKQQNPQSKSKDLPKLKYKCKVKVRSAGYNLNKLLVQIITDIISFSTQNRCRQELMKKIRILERFNLKEITHNECIGYYLLSKIYYIEEKCRDLKINTVKITKFVPYFDNLIKKGLRDYSALEKIFSSQKHNKKQNSSNYD